MRSWLRAAPVLLLAAGTGGCGPGVPPDQRPPPEWLRSDPRRCLFPRDLTENMEAHARRCAERFIAENGYTEGLNAIDTVRVVPEEGERAVTAAVFERRFGSLDPSARFVQCSDRHCFIFFEVRDPARRCQLRAVIMTWVFTRMHVRPGGVADPRCNRLPRA